MRHRVGWDLASFSFRRLRRSQFESLSLRHLQGGKRIYVLENLVQVVGEVFGLRVRESESGQSRDLEDVIAGDRNGGPPWKAVEEVQCVALRMPRPQILGGATTP
jgi:hypothetical protein